MTPKRDADDAPLRGRSIPALPDPLLQGALCDTIRTPHLKELQRSLALQKLSNSPHSELTKKDRIHEAEKILSGYDVKLKNERSAAELRFKPGGSGNYKEVIS